jgi:hypothetical protein
MLPAKPLADSSLAKYSLSVEQFITRDYRRDDSYAGSVLPINVIIKNTNAAGFKHVVIFCNAIWDNEISMPVLYMTDEYIPSGDSSIELRPDGLPQTHLGDNSSHAVIDSCFFGNLRSDVMRAAIHQCSIGKYKCY